MGSVSSADLPSAEGNSQAGYPQTDSNSSGGNSSRLNFSRFAGNHTPAPSIAYPTNFFERIKLENFKYNSSTEEEEQKWDKVEKILLADPQLMV